MIQVMVLHYLHLLYAKKISNSPNKWRLAKIAKLHPSPDNGLVRSFDLQFFDSTDVVYSIFWNIQNIAPFKLDLLAAIELFQQDLKQKEGKTLLQIQKLSMQTVKT